VKQCDPIAARAVRQEKSTSVSRSSGSLNLFMIFIVFPTVFRIRILYYLYGSGFVSCSCRCSSTV